MVALLSELVLDGDRVVAGVLGRQVADGQGAVRPIAFALEERLNKLTNS
jgi:hypothetical protein